MQRTPLETKYIFLGLQNEKSISVANIKRPFIMDCWLTSFSHQVLIEPLHCSISWGSGEAMHSFICSVNYKKPSQSAVMNQQIPHSKDNHITKQESQE